ncbi:MAG TPA: hypothetical protein PLM14_04640 [Candidatus Hydrogenedentes bacterium]|nr:hypothetical protein [Candidatus Hydrogenedentota bacterium]
MSWHACILVGLACFGGSETAAGRDFAEAGLRESWLRHPVLGDPSFDAFERLPGNPIHRGSPPYVWPVNGFLFEDPVSGNRYVYVGHYLEGYAHSADTPSRCTVFRSTDAGATWTETGPIFTGEPYTFEGEVTPFSGAPDVSVAYKDGRYHMAFDWGTANLTWQIAADPPLDANGGAAYAWADRPEGPFHPAPKPIAGTREQTLLAGKYRRMYASSIIPREKDWLVLTLTDSGPYFGWALVGRRSERPEGPYADEALLLHPEQAGYHPPLMEFFPAFVHEGYIYAPATSVARTRNFQCIWRVPIEEAMNPKAWTLWQHGSLWHAEPVEHEHYGIWGQTLTGYIDKNGAFNVMFPARDSAGRGTINLAARPWAKPYRERGFHFSGHEGPCVTLVREAGTLERLDMRATINGSVAVIWGHTAPLGPDHPASGAVPHPLTLSRHDGLELRSGGWALFSCGDMGERQIAAEGALTSPPAACSVAWTSPDALEISINGEPVWRGPFTRKRGALGLLAGTFSHVDVTQFKVTGDFSAAKVRYLFTEGLAGAAQHRDYWEETRESGFLYGLGAVSRHDGVAAKWNVACSGFALWSPTGPAYGTAEVWVDDTRLGEVDFATPEPRASRVVFRAQNLAAGYHAVWLKNISGRIPVDVLETEP